MFQFSSAQIFVALKNHILKPKQFFCPDNIVKSASSVLVSSC